MIGKNTIKGDPVKELENEMRFWFFVKVIVAIEVIALLALIIHDLLTR